MDNIFQMQRSTVERGDTKIVVEIKEGNLEEVIELMEAALRGVGFIFDGHLDIVKDEE